jgi:L-threonylcarbamoyladenylate synthase
LNIEKQIFEICLRQLKQRGSVLLLPTETVYGLICDWNDSLAQERIRRMKSRESEKPFQMLAPDIESVEEYGVEITPAIKKVVDKFCPGPVTIIAKLSRKSDLAMNTVGFRIPAYTFLLDLMKESGRLFAATSANLAGESPATTVADALDSLEEQPELAVDGGRIQGDASTVIDMTGKGVKILREGVVTEEELRKLYHKW